MFSSETVFTSDNWQKIFDRWASHSLTFHDFIIRIETNRSLAENLQQKLEPFRRGFMHISDWMTAESSLPQHDLQGNEPLESFIFFLRFIDDKNNFGFDLQENQEYLAKRWKVPVANLRPFIEQSYSIHGPNSRLTQTVVTVASVLSSSFDSNTEH